MGKLYEEYLKLKEENKEKLYLFKCGKFYIFLADDYDTINEYVVLKKVLFSKNIYKCGFPSNVLDNYLRVFNNHKLNVEIIENIEKKEIDLEKYLKNIDINQITPLEALLKLKEMKEKIK